MNNFEQYAEISDEQLVEVAREFEKEALRHALADPLAMANAKSAYWETLCLAGGVRLVILDRRPDDEAALKGFYELTRLYEYRPPALASVITRVVAHYQRAVAEHPNEPMSYMRLAMATNVAQGMSKGQYPGSRYLKRAVSLSRDHAEICVEMGRYTNSRKRGWLPWRSGGRDAAVKWFERAISIDPDCADAYLELGHIEGSAKAPDKARVEDMLSKAASISARSSTPNVFAQQYHVILAHRIVGRL